MPERTMTFTRHALIVAALVSLALGAAVTQEPGLLRIKAVLADAGGKITPVSRYTLLISDNPASAEPRRIVTALEARTRRWLGMEAETL